MRDFTSPAPPMPANHPRRRALDGGLADRAWVPAELGTLPILVVDDEPGVRRSVSWALSGEGYPVTAAPDVASAIAALEESDFAAILTDLRLPGGPGLVLVDEVERRGLSTPVILMSGSLQELDGSDPRIQRLAGVVAKPFDLHTLRSVIAAVLGRPQ
jgi:two-component system alkaline phosphatase synthesis response regulator PhoP